MVVNRELGEMWNLFIIYFKGLTVNLENVFLMSEYNPAYLHISVKGWKCIIVHEYCRPLQLITAVKAVNSIHCHVSWSVC